MSVRRSIDDGVLNVCICRPEALNAIDYEVMTGLEEALDVAETNRDIRVFVLRGDGDRSFISGGDLTKFAQIETRRGVEHMATRMKAILDRLETLDCWTIAAINGDAYGGGCETLLAFDFRLAADHARFGFTQAKFHVPPGWGGLTRLVETVGRPTALDWLARAAIVDAETARHAGLIHEVIPAADLHDAVRERSRTIAKSTRELIAALKNGARRAEELPRSDAMADELEPFCDLWLGNEHHERVETFLARKDRG